MSVCHVFVLHWVSLCLYLFFRGWVCVVYLSFGACVCAIFLSFCACIRVVSGSFTASVCIFPFPSVYELMSISCPSVRGFGMTLTGGRCNCDGSTSAIVTSLERGGSADKSGLCLGKTVNVALCGDTIVIL